jgi:hypothetical protein
MLRKLLVLSVLVFLVGGLSTTSTAQASNEMFRHPSYIVRGLFCIHHYEGSWTDPGSPYWGGLQMDLSFQRTYGWIRVAKHTPNAHKIYFLDKWGTADRWPVWAQLVAGLHGYFSRGWDPWPNTARYCGLR